MRAHKEPMKQARIRLPRRMRETIEEVQERFDRADFSDAVRFTLKRGLEALGMDVQNIDSKEAKAE
ncbi:MAG TPA: hypothetical protein PKV78_13670 [Methanoculleus thermophilus]|nr:hypothetical protein [Methanoculleus thermophilus]